ncbi:MAG: HopJ type III effector protein, partial [Glaciecola sp.]
MTPHTLIANTATAPETIEFQDVMAVISNYYDYIPSTFTNGDVVNEAQTNEG